MTPFKTNCISYDQATVGPGIDLQDLFDTTQRFSWVLDEDGKIISCNEAVSDRLGYVANELTGKSLFETGILPENARYNLFPGSGIPGSMHRTQSCLKIRDGSRLSVLCTAEKLSIHKRPCYLVSAVDISSWQPFLHSIVKKKRAQDPPQIGLNNIFSVIAHDLRSPFNTILGFCELLSDSIREGETDKYLPYVKIIQDASTTTLGFLLRLLEWGRLQQGKILFTPEYFILEKQVSDILQLYSYQADTKIIKLETFMDPGFIVYGDKNMIRTILSNLISNAIKFTRPGGKVIISARNEQEIAEITIADNGIGISAEMLSRLFSGNQPCTNPGTSMEQGTGLGLLFCRNFIAMHHGKIWAESENGEGTRFKFTLPFPNLG
jgi:two-component system, sensor histidine kinase and response regulator